MDRLVPLNVGTIMLLDLTRVNSFLLLLYPRFLSVASSQLPSPLSPGPPFPPPPLLFPPWPKLYSSVILVPSCASSLDVSVLGDCIGRRIHPLTILVPFDFGTSLIALMVLKSMSTPVVLVAGVLGTIALSANSVRLGPVGVEE